MKSLLKEILRLFLIILFVYTATNKLLTLDKFIIVLSRFPYLKSHSLVLAYVVPLVELGISLMLIIPRFYKYGIKFSFVLMMFFTSYLAYMVVILGEKNLPCSCGGIISSLNWSQHLIFNIGVIVAIGISLSYDKRKRNI